MKGEFRWKLRRFLGTYFRRVMCPWCSKMKWDIWLHPEYVPAFGHVDLVCRWPCRPTYDYDRSAL